MDKNTSDWLYGSALPVPTRRKVTLRRLFLAGLIGTIIVLMSRKPPITVVSMPIPAQWDGVTVCSQDNRPVVILQVGIAGTEMEGVVLTHEMVHVRQNLAYKGGCKALQIRYNRDSVFRKQTEKEAYCAQVGYIKKMMPDQLDGFMAYLRDEVHVSCRTTHGG